MLTFKQKICNLFWPIGRTAKILIGPLKGFKFLISENSGWSPIIGRWEPESQFLFTKIIKKNSVIYDLGANNGIHSLLFSKLTGKDGKVFSFEPLPENCKEIENNARLNNLENISVIQTAVSNKTGATTFSLGLHNKQGSLVGIGRSSGNFIDVSLITLDDFIDQGNSAPDFIKIDIEGAEGLALSGFEKNIQKILPIFFIELHTPEQDRQVGSFFLKHNYNVYRLVENTNSKLNDLTGLEYIKDLDQPFPSPTGIWGTLLAIHKSKTL